MKFRNILINKPTKPLRVAILGELYSLIDANTTYNSERKISFLRWAAADLLFYDNVLWNKLRRACESRLDSWIMHPGVHVKWKGVLWTKGYI